MTTSGRWMRMGSGRHETQISAEMALLLRQRLHDMMRPTILVIPLALPAIVAVFAPTVASLPLLFGWVALAAIAGLVQWFAYLRRWSPHDWTSRAVATQVLGGTTWGLFPWLTIADDPIWQALGAGLLLAVMASSTQFASPLRATYLAFIGPIGLLAPPAYLVLGDGDARWTAVLVVAMAGFVGFLAEIAHRNHVEAASLTVRLRERAATDSLTGLSNRHTFTEVLRTRLDAPVPSVGVIFIDLDGFKSVNDRFGHVAGDRLLRIIGQRLRRAVGHRHLVARFGGDEFTVLVDDADETSMQSVATDLCAAAADTVSIDGRAVSVGASIGTTIARPGDTIDDVLRRADRAQYTAKRTGGHAVASADVDRRADQGELLA